MSAGSGKWISPATSTGPAICCGRRQASAPFQKAVGSLDDAGRPRLVALSLPRDRLTLGPAQATRRILANPEISRRLQLVNRESRDLGKAAVSRTVLGAPRVVPVGDALVHVQPVYLSAGGEGVPRLQLVTAYANGRVGSGPDLESALRRAVRRP